MFNRTPWLRAHPRGVSTIELAVIMPLLLLLTLGLIEYGWMFLKSHQVTNAARQGARVAARIDANAASAQSAVDQAMAAGGLSGTGYTVAVDPADLATLEAGQLFTVSVTVQYANVRLLGITLIPQPSQLSATVTMAKEGA